MGVAKHKQDVIPAKAGIQYAGTSVTNRSLAEYWVARKPGDDG